MYFIIVKDVLNNEETIINQRPISSDTLTTFFELFFNAVSTSTSSSQFHKLSLNTHCSADSLQSYAEIVSETHEIQKGWVWNSKRTVKQVLYVLRVIGLDKKVIHVTHEVTTQTETEHNGHHEHHHHDHHKEHHHHHKKHHGCDCDDCESESDSELTLPQKIKKTIFETVFQQTESGSKSESSDESEERCTDTESEEHESELVDLNLGLGYSHSILFPQLRDKFKTELEVRLKEPNFGLKKF